MMLLMRIHLVAGPNATYYIWSVSSDGLLQLRPTNRNPQDEEDVVKELIEPGTEFALHFLDGHRVVIASVGQNQCDASPSEMYLLKAELKGEIKMELTSDVSVSNIWEM